MAASVKARWRQWNMSLILVAAAQDHMSDLDKAKGTNADNLHKSNYNS